MVFKFTVLQKPPYNYEDDIYTSRIKVLINEVQEKIYIFSEPEEVVTIQYEFSIVFNNLQ